MTGAGQRVAIITGGSQGIGAGLVAAYRRRDWAVVANSRTIKPSEDGAVLTISGDISEPATTDRIIGEAPHAAIVVHHWPDATRAGLGFGAGQLALTAIPG